MNKKKPDIVVWDELNEYNANTKHYPTTIGSPKFELPDIGLVKNEASKKMIDVFNRQREEIIQSIETLQKEYMDSLMVWESKISFDPIVGETYYLSELSVNAPIKSLSLFQSFGDNNDSVFTPLKLYK